MVCSLSFDLCLEWMKSELIVSMSAYPSNLKVVYCMVNIGNV